MEKARAKRYVDKIAHIRKRIKEFELWKNDFFIDEKTKLACYKAIQEVIECCMDIVSMIVRDENSIPKDDYTNIEILNEKRIITHKIARALKELNGLRNRIVHEYNGLNDDIAFSSAEELVRDVEEFLRVVEEWLKKKL